MGLLLPLLFSRQTVLRSYSVGSLPGGPTTNTYARAATIGANAVGDYVSVNQSLSLKVATWQRQPPPPPTKWIFEVDIESPRKSRPTVNAD